MRRQADRQAVERVNKLTGSQANQLDVSLARLEAGFPASPLDVEPASAFAGLSTNRQADAVNHPAHYADGWSNGTEVIDITEHLNFCRGNAVKYLARAGAKDPAREIEDLRKAAWYVAREITRLEAL